MFKCTHSFIRQYLEIVFYGPRNEVGTETTAVIKPDREEPDTQGNHHRSRSVHAKWDVDEGTSPGSAVSYVRDLSRMVSLCRPQ